MENKEIVKFKKILRNLLLRKIQYAQGLGFEDINLHNIAMDIINDVYETYPEHRDYIELIDILNPYEFMLIDGNEVNLYE